MQTHTAYGSYAPPQRPRAEPGRRVDAQSQAEPIHVVQQHEDAEELVDLGAGELVLNSIDADGTKDGYDVELTRTVADRVDVPIVASGGCGGPEHMLDVLSEGHASAALAASIFHFEQHSIPEVKEYLTNRGVLMRPKLDLGV